MSDLPRLTRREGPLDLIRRANQVSIFDVLQDYFGISHPREGRSFKGRCPFADEHSDGGLDPGWRTYPSTNSSYCFVLHGVLDPVQLVALERGVKPARAAKLILERYGLLAAKPYHLRFREMVADRETRETAIGSPAYLVEALHAAARRSDREVQGRYLEEALEELDEILAGAHPDEVQVRAWFRRWRERMTG